MPNVVEPLISGLVENLISLVFSFIGSKLPSGEMNQVQEQVKDWKITLEDISGFLMDADARKENHPAVRRWLADLEELIFDAEDLIELFNYEILRRQLEHTEPESSCGPAFDLQRLIPFTKRRRTEESWENSDLVGKLNEITGRFQRLKERKRDLNLFIMPVTSSAGLESSRFTRDPSGPLPTEPVIFGRDDYKQEIIEILKEEEGPKIGVLPIVGMGGLGKTTLARYVYNDDEIKSYFNVRGWVCVSSDYDTRRITKDVLESVSRKCGDIKDKALGWIQARLGKKLRNKKFLLVLDDNWNENYRDWNTLKSPFDEGLRGSKIIVTTRSQNVANTVGTVPCIIPNLLSEKDCWSLFCIHANLDSNGTSCFEIVGEEISRKCSGLPLAVMTMGGMLRNKRRLEEWENVRDSMPSVSEDVMSVLKLSYNDLTSQFKLCFSFLALFPEDYEFGEDEVALLWIAAGLIQPSATEKRSKLEVSRDCFRKLLSRSLFSPTKRQDWPYIDYQLYVMHDLVRQLAQKVSLRNLYIDTDDDSILTRKSTQHLSFNCSRFQNIMDRIIQGGKHTVLPWRTVVLLDDPPSPFDTIKHEMFLRLKCVRALSLMYFQGKELPESIGQMKLLRCLNLSYSDIQILPMSITSLHNLETLDLRSCSSLEQLPEKIEKLINLWYLDITYCELKELPVGIKELKRLEKLSRFIVDDKLSVASLGNLKLLRGSLWISSLDKVISPEEAAFARLSEKILDKLCLWWGYWSGDDWTKMETERKVLEQLQPHENLKVLEIHSYAGQMFPCWLTGSLKCLTVLEISDCVNCSELFIPNSLVSLKELEIEDCYKMEVHLPEMPNLESLRVMYCSHVACADTFSTVALDDLVIDKCAMSELFKEKVRLGFPNVRELHVCNQSRMEWKYHWSLPDFSMIADNYEEELNVEELNVEELHVDAETVIDRLPVWVCKAKSLNKIVVKNCPSLKILIPYRDIPPCLRSIEIHRCPQLTSILSQDSLPEIPNKSLTRIEVDRCSSLKVLLTSRFTAVFDCSSLESFHEVGLLPHSMESLVIKNCPLISQKLRQGDEHLWSMISPEASVEVDGEELNRI